MQGGGLSLQTHTRRKAAPVPLARDGVGHERLPSRPARASERRDAPLPTHRSLIAARTTGLAARLARLTRRARAAVRLLRIDTPVMWRMAAHGAVLALSFGVVLVNRLPGAGPAEAEAATPGELTHFAARVGQGARFLLPQPVLGTETGAPDGEGGAADPGGPGFISTGPIAEADPSLLPWDEPQRYVVQDGDTITGIAAQFGVEPETLLYANPAIRANPHSLSIGDEITVLPVNGVLHVVAEGDTLESVAALYKGSVEKILAYAPNGLAAGEALVAGAEVVVPGGEMDIVIPSYIQMVQGPGRVSSPWTSDGGSGSVVGSGSFYVPAYGRITTRYTRWHPGVDIANHTGTPIYAIDGGSVEVAGWYGWAGNAVIVDHGNGYESLYAHMNSIAVSAGQSVQRGQNLGTIGCTRGYGGRCTGPHLHLEVFYQGGHVNPCSLGLC